MMNLKIETKKEALKRQIINAYENAIMTCNISDFILAIKNNISQDMKVGKGHSHIWISDNDDSRCAIIYL